MRDCCRYCQNAGGNYGISPEDCGLSSTVSALCAWRDANVPGLEVWLSEFGYDTASAGTQVRSWPASY